jgi:hypothetical protein
LSDSDVIRLGFFVVVLRFAFLWSTQNHTLPRSLCEDVSDGISINGIVVISDSVVHYGTDYWRDTGLGFAILLSARSENKKSIISFCVRAFWLTHR